MAAIQSRTREQIRRAVAANLDQLPSGIVTGNGSTTTLLDTTLIGGDDEYNGGWLVFTSGTNDGLIRRVTDYTSSTGTFTFTPAASASTATNDTYEFWRSEFPPARIHELINESIIQRTPRGLIHDEDISNHGHRNDSRYSIPSDMIAVSAIDYRYAYDSEQIQDANVVWSEVVDGNVTLTLDTEDFKAHNGALRIQTNTGGGSVSSGDVLAAQAITSTDLRGMNAVEFFFKSTTATSAGDYTLNLSSSSSLGTITETLSIPAVAARTWTYCRVSLANPELDGAIISVGIKAVSTNTRYIYINDIKAVNTESAVFNRLWSGSYRIDREGREIFLTEQARKEVGYSLIRMVGYRLPVLLNADATACEIDPSLVTARATSKALFTLARGSVTDPDDNDRRAAYFEGVASQSEQSLPILKPGTKMVD